jgi:hypothetical protein
MVETPRLEAKHGAISRSFGVLRVNSAEKFYIKAKDPSLTLRETH